MKNSIQKFACFLLVLFSVQLYCSATSWNYFKGGEDWVQSCKKGNQAPIDIASPFTHKSIKLDFKYGNMYTEYVMFNDGNNLILQGDYGYVKLDGTFFFSTEMKIFSPFSHSFSQHKMPLEIQIHHNDKKENRLVVSLLFTYSDDYSMLLGKLGFDSAKLQSEKPFKYKFVKKPIDISNILNNDKTFFWYEAKNPTPPCEKNAKFLILTDVLKISKKQMNNFPKIVKNQNRNIQSRNHREIFTTFRVKNSKEEEKTVQEKIKAAKKTSYFNYIVKQVQNQVLHLKSNKSKSPSVLKILLKAKAVSRSKHIIQPSFIFPISNQPLNSIDTDFPKTNNEKKSAVLQKHFQTLMNVYT